MTKHEITFVGRVRRRFFLSYAKVKIHCTFLQKENFENRTLRKNKNLIYSMKTRETECDKHSKFMNPPPLPSRETNELCTDELLIAVPFLSTASLNLPIVF